MAQAVPTSEPLATVVMPTWNGAEELPRVLAALFRQELDAPFEVLAVDSGSTDGTLEILARYPVRVLHIEQAAFNHGDTRNLAIAHARGPYVVLLSQDAEPADPHWLQHLLGPLRRDPRVAGACSRLLPPPNLDPLLRRLVLSDLNASAEERVAELRAPDELDQLSPYEARLRLNFHDVASALRRRVWERLPFQRLPFGEDLFWARAALEAGWRLCYVPAARVYHGHRYGPRSLYQRAWWDGWLNRRLLDRRPIARARDLLPTILRSVGADWRHLRSQGWALSRRLRALPRSAALGAALFWGLYRGARATRPAYLPRQPLPERPLRLLLVVHGFPPHDVAGTEVYTATVARALRREGWEVAVFHRVADPAGRDYSLVEEVVEGIRVYRVVNNGRYASVRETYENPHVEGPFLAVLAREAPDVVHVQHALHTSASLIRLCADRGLPVIVTLHDYWFICPTVQLILPEGRLCSPRRAGLACVHCARRADPVVRWGQALVRALGPFARWLPRLYARVRNRCPRFRLDAAEDALALSRRPAAMRAYLARASWLLAPSRFLADQYRRFGVDPERLAYLRYGIRTEELLAARKAPRGGRPLRVGFIGSFVWYKGLHVLLEAFRGLGPEEARLTVYGNPEHPPEVRAYAARCRELARGTPVTFAGPLPRERLAAVHRELDLLVVPSLWYENSPLVILEAQTAGTPVVASRLGGMAELVRDGVNGRLFPPGDSRALRAVLRDLAARPGEVARLAAGTRPAKDMETHVQELTLLYRQEITRLRPASGRVPFWTGLGRSFTEAEGAVECQGEDLVLLRPRPGGSRVSYRVRVPAPGPVRVEVVTRLLPGERSVLLAGRVYLDGRPLGEVAPHRAGDGPGVLRRHVFRGQAARLEAVLTLETAQSPTPAFLRIQRVAVFADLPENEACTIFRP